MKKVLASMGLIAATMLWGSTFAFQRTAMEHISPCVFTAIRSLVGVAALAVLILLTDLFTLKRISLWGKKIQSREDKRCLLWGGFFCGLAITPAMLAQQMGLCETSAGKSGFLTALYIIIVPVLGILFKRKTNLLLWGAVFLALSGSFLLCSKPGEGLALSRGDLMVIVCAFLYSVHILVSDHFAVKTDCIRLSLLQFVMAVIISSAASLFFSNESWSWQSISNSAFHWIYCGIASCAIAFTLQMLAQKYLHPVITSLLMSLESVFAVLAGWLFLQEYLSGREFAGCILLFVAVIAAQLPSRKKTEKICTVSQE